MTINFMGQKLNVVNVVIIFIVGAIMSVSLWCNCAGGILEGFTAAKDLSGAAMDYTMGNGVKGSWENQNPEETPHNWYETNTGGEVPLPEGQLSMFYNNKSSADCCPSTYSTSTGCVCATSEQMNYLNRRGGNRTLSTIY